MYKLFCPVLFILYSLSGSAQEFGGNPPSIKWKQINTDTVKIIFPPGLDSQAQRVAALVHYQAKYSPVPLGKDLHKINIVLQNQTVISNGYVGLAPYRSEFFMTPVLNNFDFGSTGWADGLAIHEYRHVQQYNNFRNGLSKFAYYLLGEEGLALATGTSVPDWFYEGDAVYNETVLSKQGRGRLPLFLNEYKSLWQSGKKYSWMKLRNGSLKDFVPTHYPLGYLMVNYGREKYGIDFWEKVTKDASAFKGLFYPFQRAVKKYSGVSYKTFREGAFEFTKLNSDVLYKSAPNQSAKPDSESSTSPLKLNQATEPPVTTILPVNKKYVTDYVFPYSINADSLLYLKRSYRHIPAFYIKDAAGEHKIAVRDISADDQYSYRNGKIVYAAYEPDARWAWRDYSVIKILDVYSGEQKTITRRSKYFTPDISANGEWIAAVQLGTDGKSELHILHTGTGEVIQKIKAADVAVFTDPKFIDESSLITAVRLQDGRMALAKADIVTGSVERMTPLSYNVVGFPQVKNDTVYFTASYSGNDDLYAMPLSNKKIFKLSSAPLGKYYVNASDDKLTYSGFTADGYQLQQQSADKNAWAEVDMESLQKSFADYSVSHSDNIQDILVSKAGSGNYSVKPYKKSTKLFNFHSWRPDYTDPEFSFSLYGQNVLNTFESQIYYVYNQNEKSNAVGFTGTYGAWFPYVSGGTEFTFNRTAGDTVGSRQWNQVDTRVGLSIPFNFTKGKSFRNLDIGTNYVLRNEKNTGAFKNNFAENNFTYLHHFISYAQQIQRARQHIYPRLGYTISLNHRYAVTNINGYQFLGSAALYLPGVHVNHNLVLTGSFQQRDTLRQLFSNRFALSRGYQEFYLSRMWRLSGNYHFPIAYPDWGFANIFYINRIRGNAFYDFTKVYSRNKTQTRDLRSAGGEIYFDTKWWNQVPVSFGFRVSHQLDNELNGVPKGNIFEFILPVNLVPR
jgi:hypothetical protein